MEDIRISSTIPVVIHNSRTASDSPSNDPNTPGDDGELEDSGPSRTSDDLSDDRNEDGPEDPPDPSEELDHSD